MQTKPPLALQQHGQFDTVVLLDPVRMSYSFQKKAPTEQNRLPDSLSGWTAIVNGIVCSMFKFDDALWIGFDCRAYEVTSALDSEWVKHGTRNFVLYCAGETIENIHYSLRNVASSIEPFVVWDEESSDFLLWMHNMLHSPERRSLVLRDWS